GIEANVQAGRDAFDFRGIAPAVAMGTLNTAILGSLGNITRAAIPGEGMRYSIGRILTGIPVGIGEQQIADTIGSALHLQTGYGLIGQFARGEKGEAWKNLVGQFFTFAAFGVLHEARHQPAPQAEGPRGRRAPEGGLPGPEP